MKVKKFSKKPEDFKNRSEAKPIICYPNDSLDDKNLDYTYDGYQLTIELPKEYKKGEHYTLYLKYIARPEKVKDKGSIAITAAKGLYFINSTGSDPNKPTQIWTQGETEANSCWFPTIDSPNQKTTQEIYMTVPDKFLTLSNGILKSQTKNSDGTRTDYWKMDQKHAPYLVFMGVGEYSVVKDSWNNLEVNYYVEKEFESVARDIFGNTPEMMTFFSNLTGIPYPWDKYSQIVVRDYVSGAMENTTAVVHGEDAQQKRGQLIDKNEWEGTIAHELFHHWFGDLVTTESWANLTVNESFATYSVYLWLQHKYGQDAADAPFVFLATGTGIAPFLSYIKTFETPPARCLYGVRREADAIGYEELRLHCPTHLAVSREPADGHHQGRITDLLDLLPLDSATHYYCCGLESMVNDVSAWLQENGIGLSHIHREVFFHG